MRKAALNAWANNPERRKQQSERSWRIAQHLWNKASFRRQHGRLMRKYWQDPKWRKTQSQKIKQGHTDPEYRAEASEKSTKFWADPVWRTRQIQIFKKSFRAPAHRKRLSLYASRPESKKRSSDLFKQLWRDRSFRERKILELKQRWSIPGEKRKFKSKMESLWLDPLYRRKFSRIKSNDAKRLWSDPDYRERHIKLIIQGRRQCPTDPEKKLHKLLRRLCPNEFAYNGNRGCVILANHIPDFVNVNGRKQVIEVFGCYWHGCRFCGHSNITKARADRQRINDFRKLGWKSLVVWEHELKNPARLEGKIKAFVV